MSRVLGWVTMDMKSPLPHNDGARNRSTTYQGHLPEGEAGLPPGYCGIKEAVGNQCFVLSECSLNKSGSTLFMYSHHRIPCRKLCSRSMVDFKLMSLSK